MTPPCRQEFATLTHLSRLSVLDMVYTVFSEGQLENMFKRVDVAVSKMKLDMFECDLHEKRNGRI